ARARTTAARTRSSMPRSARSRPPSTPGCGAAPPWRAARTAVACRRSRPARRSAPRWRTRSRRPRSRWDSDPRSRHWSGRTRRRWTARRRRASPRRERRRGISRAFSSKAIAVCAKLGPALGHSADRGRVVPHGGRPIEHGGVVGLRHGGRAGKEPEIVARIAHHHRLGAVGLQPADQIPGAQEGEEAYAPFAMAAALDHARGRLEQPCRRVETPVALAQPDAERAVVVAPEGFHRVVAVALETGRD